jgi:hypothetical protein
VGRFFLVVASTYAAYRLLLLVGCFFARLGEKATDKQYNVLHANDSGPGDIARATLWEAVLTIGQVPPIQRLAEQRTGFVELPRAPGWCGDVG